MRAPAAELAAPATGGGSVPGANGELIAPGGSVVVGERSGTQEGVTQRIVHCGSHAVLLEQFVGGDVSNG